MRCLACGWRPITALIISLYGQIAWAQDADPLPSKPNQFFHALVPDVSYAQQGILTDRELVIQGFCRQDAVEAWSEQDRESLIGLMEAYKLSDASVKVFTRPTTAANTDRAEESDYAAAVQRYCHIGEIDELPFRTIQQRQALVELLHRVDIVPSSQALAQAALESAYGRSRFARQGHALFGEHCDKPGCGIVPSGRAKGSSFEVKAFDSYQAAVVSYMYMLNTSPTFKVWREMRWQERMAEPHLSGTALLTALSQYSQIGQQYAKSLLAIIQEHELTRWDNE